MNIKSIADQRVVSLDNNRIILINGDSIAILPMLHESVDLIIADPPYFGVVKDEWDNQWNTTEDYLQWSRKWIEPAIKVMKESGSFYCWGGIGEKTRNMIHLILLIDELGLHFKDMITWKKRRGYGSRRGYLYAREEIVWYVKNNKQFIWNTLYQYSDELSTFNNPNIPKELRKEFKRIPSVWTDIVEQLSGKQSDKKDKKHYTPKPLKAIQRIIQLHTTNKDQIVLDPFLGSGTTGQVCAALGQRCIGIEQDKATFDDAVAVIKQTLNERRIKETANG